jgi:hypothetical protein
MIVRHALLLAAALTLGSCCLSGNCYAPITGTAGVAAEAPDGLGSVPTDEPQAEAAPAKPKKTAQRRKDFDPVGDTSAVARYRGDTYEQQQAADQAAEERLKRKLIICQNCSSSGN